MRIQSAYKSMCLSALTLCLGLSCYATASESMPQNDADSRLKIEFVEPKSFTDIRPSNQSRAKFREHVLKTMQDYFDELAQTLPEGQVLAVTVEDIDLAGDTRSPRVPIGSTMFDVRVMEDIYFPRIKFSFVLTDANGEQLQADQVNLKDMSYLNRAGRIRNNTDAFPYEKNMLEKWFKDTFKQSDEQAS
ncbi:DUF3016 domain-containing protein [Glaciecola siphonariae]|uniref:DUF3016 domain-containing protein n=1 Tax=Glaciecola siphonariae TaxID=521012 RepID=A0ABV9LV88_9ALTE